MIMYKIISFIQPISTRYLSLEIQEVKTMFGKNSKSGKASKSSKMAKSAKNVEASKEAKGCSSKANSSAKNCKQFSAKIKVHDYMDFYCFVKNQYGMC